MLRAGIEHWFESAKRELRVTGHVAYDDGLVRYRVEGDPDIHSIDQLAARRRERALNRLAPADVTLKGERAVYFTVEFTPRSPVRRIATGAGGELGELGEWNGAIEEIEYVRAGASGRSLLRVTAGSQSKWFLVTAATLEPQAEPAQPPPAGPDRASASAAVAPAAGTRRGASPEQYRYGELAALATYLYLAASIFHGLANERSDNHFFWSERIQGLMVFEFILVGAGFMSVAMRQGVHNRDTGKVEPPGIFFPILMLVFGLVYGLVLFKFSFLFLVYMVRLVALMWTGFTVPAERWLEEGQRRALGMVAYISIAGVIVPLYGNGSTAFMKWGALYFSALALIELFMLLRPPPAPTQA